MNENVLLGMHNIPRCEYRRPSNLEECFEILGADPEHALILAGGTDLIPAFRSGKLSLPQNSVLVDISKIREISYISEAEGVIRIGAGTKLSEIAGSEVIAKSLPVLAETVKQMGSLQIRNMATIGGNLCNASPAADSAIPLLISNATLKVGNGQSFRSVDVSAFFTGPGQTVLQKGELLLEIKIQVPPKKSMCKFYKLGRRNAFTLSVVSVGVYMEKDGNAVKEARIAFGAVAPTPIRATEIEKYLVGKRLDSLTIEEAAGMVENIVRPITDVRASEWYRKEMARNLLKKILFSFC